jgi:hypothetical protein
VTGPGFENIPGAAGHPAPQAACCLWDGCQSPASGSPAEPGPSQPPEGRERFCGTCLSWLDTAAEPHPGRIIVEWSEVPRDGSIAAGQHRKNGTKPRHIYYLEPGKVVVETQSPAGLGFGGTPFRLTFGNGRSLETNNLWHEAEIPARFHDLFPVTARLQALGYYGGGRYDGKPPLHLARQQAPDAAGSPAPGPVPDRGDRAAEPGRGDWPGTAADGIAAQRGQTASATFPGRVQPEAPSRGSQPRRHPTHAVRPRRLA